MRVLGALIEKALTTPDYYPLSLNALKNACNQTSNREPIVSYDETTVKKTLDLLKEKSLIWDSRSVRVAKYGESLSKNENLMPRELIILALLMLKGPQTPGALRARSERVYAFENLEEVHEGLENLSEWGFMQQLPRQAGHKELRYAHLFAKQAVNEEITDLELQSEIENEIVGDGEKLEQLEAELKQVRSDLAQLKTAFLNFKDQF